MVDWQIKTYPAGIELLVTKAGRSIYIPSSARNTACSTTDQAMYVPDVLLILRILLLLFYVLRID